MVLFRRIFFLKVLPIRYNGSCWKKIFSSFFYFFIAVTGFCVYIRHNLGGILAEVIVCFQLIKQPVINIHHNFGGTFPQNMFLNCLIMGVAGLSLLSQRHNRNNWPLIKSYRAETPHTCSASSKTLKFYKFFQTDLNFRVYGPFPV